VTVIAHQQLLQHPFELPKLTWYQRRYRRLLMQDTLSRQQLWQMLWTFRMSSTDMNTDRIPRALFSTWSGLLLLMDKSPSRTDFSPLHQHQLVEAMVGNNVM